MYKNVLLMIVVLLTTDIEGRYAELSHRVEDMVIPETKLSAFGITDPDNRFYQNIFCIVWLTFDCRWPEGQFGTIIEYLIHEKSEVLRENITTAMSHIEAVSCVRFKEIKKDVNLLTKEFILFESAEKGCFSDLGRQIAKPTRVNLEISQNCSSVVTITHELFHAFGFVHEHQRPDRDNFLKIHWDKIKDFTLMKNIERWSENDTTAFYTPYDYHSIMQYRMKDNNGATILEPYNSIYSDIIRYQNDMSIGDEIALNLHFNCPTVTLDQLERYNQFRVFNDYQDLKQLSIKSTPEAQRSYLLYPPRVVISTMDEMAEQYPNLAGSFTRVPLLLRNDRPVWQHSKNPDYQIDFSGVVWRILNVSDNSIVMRTSPSKSIMLEVDCDAWQYFDKNTQSFTSYGSFYINHTPVKAASQGDKTKAEQVNTDSKVGEQCNSIQGNG